MSYMDNCGQGQSDIPIVIFVKEINFLCLYLVPKFVSKINKLRRQKFFKALIFELRQQLSKV